jgi:protein SCO1
MPSSMQGMSWVAAGGLLSCGIGVWAYMQYSMALKRKATLEAYETSAGEAQVGGPFTLTDTNGKPFSSSQLQGEFSILYFGFTHCPDICPDELEKMAEALDKVGATLQLHTLS